jgi:hypothetical protein
MAVEVYQGTYVTAESAYNYIDVAKINSGCELLKEAADMYKSVGSTINEAAGICNNEALSVFGATMQSSIEDCGNSIIALDETINNQISMIEEAVEKALELKQQELNATAQALDNQKILENQNQS